MRPHGRHPLFAGKRVGLAAFLLLALCALALTWGGEPDPSVRAAPAGQDAPDRFLPLRAGSPQTTRPAPLPTRRALAGPDDRGRVGAPALWGRVVAAATGRPLAGVRVQAWYDGFASYHEESVVGRYLEQHGPPSPSSRPPVRTNEAGRFRISGLDPRLPWRVVATRSGWGRVSVPAYSEWKDRPRVVFRPVEIRLAPAGQVWGRAVSARDGSVLAGIEIHLTTGGDWIEGDIDNHPFLDCRRYLAHPCRISLRTDSSGRFRFDGLDPRLEWRLGSTGARARQRWDEHPVPTRISMDRLGFYRPPAPITVSMDGMGPVTLRLEPRPRVDLELIPLGPLDRGSPTTVRIQYHLIVKGPGGRPRLDACGFRYHGAWPATDRVSIPLWGKENLAVEVVVSDRGGARYRGASGHLVGRVHGADATLELTPITHLRGRVLGPDGRPRPGARILHADPWRHRHNHPVVLHTTDRQGWFRLWGTPGMESTIRILAPGCRTLVHRVRPAPGQVDRDLGRFHLVEKSSPASPSRRSD